MTMRKTPMRNRASLSPMNLAAPKPMTLAEFLKWEERQDLRYEFDGSAPVAMTGGSLAHAAIQRNLALALGSRLRGKPCQFFGSDLKIQAAENSSRYPDGMVICSGLDPTLKIVRNPVVIFEVLSPSTAAADRIVKAREYQATPSVQRYVMLEQARIGATVHVRAEDGWRVLVLKDDDALALPEIGLAIPLAEFYEGLTFDDHPIEDNDNEQTPPAA
jgi:Uma2 family endonuclease